MLQHGGGADKRLKSALFSSVPVFHIKDFVILFQQVLIQIVSDCDEGHIMNFASAISDNPNVVGKHSDIWKLAY